MVDASGGLKPLLCGGAGVAPPADGLKRGSCGLATGAGSGSAVGVCMDCAVGRGAGSASVGRQGSAGGGGRCADGGCDCEDCDGCSDHSGDGSRDGGCDGCSGGSGDGSRTGGGCSMSKEIRLAASTPEAFGKGDLAVETLFKTEPRIELADLDSSFDFESGGAVRSSSPANEGSLCRKLPAPVLLPFPPFPRLPTLYFSTCLLVIAFSITRGSGATLTVRGLVLRLSVLTEVGEKREINAPQPVQYLALPRRIEAQD